MGSAENGAGQHPAPEWRRIGTHPPSPWDVYDIFPNVISEQTFRDQNIFVNKIISANIFWKIIYLTNILGA